MKKHLFLKTLLVLIGILIGSVTQSMWAKTKNVAWKGNIFFRAPDNWDLSTNSTIQVGVARTTNVDNKTYIAFLATMDRVGTTRLYYKWVDNSHGKWNQNEYVFFTANSSSQSNGGDRKVNAYACYTTPIEGEFEDSEYPFLFNPTSESNGASVTKTRYTTGSKYDDRIPSCLNFAQTVNLYTNGSASNTGGSVNISGTALTGNTSTTSVNTTSSSNSVSDNTVVGSSVTLTATPASGYNFDGWYTVSSGGEAVSTSTTYPAYTCTGAKTLYARFVTASTKKLTVSAGTGISGTSGTTDNITAGQNITIGATVATGYTWNTWTLTGDGTLSTFTAGTKDQTVTVGTAANMTLTASATENMSALTTSCSYNTGTPGYDAPAVTGSYTTVGYVTTREITAATPGATYYLSGWTITNGARTDDGGDTANPITVRSNGNGSAVSVVANYSTKTKVRLYTSNPDNWGTVYAYVWSSSNTSDKNANWHGDNITSKTIERNGTTYWYYEYYKEDYPNWNRVIFNNNNDKQTNDITFSNTTHNGQYHSAGDRYGSHSDGSWNALPAAETTYSITFNAGAHGSITAYGEEITAGNSANVEIGSTARSLTASNATGYHFNGWTKTNNNVTIADASSASTTISASGTSTVTATWAANTYTITLNDNGGSGGDGTHSVTYNSATGSLSSAPERDHYTFGGYYASSGGTGTKVFNANLTPVQNAATYTDNTSDKKWIYAGDKELYAKWTEVPYTVTLQNATESSVSAGCETGTNITAVTAGLAFGLGFDHWEVVSGSATFVNANAVTTKVKATSDCTVKAVYAQKLYAFIEGRFHVASASNHDSWTNTFSGNVAWDQDSRSIQFAYDESSHIFYLHTYATANALTTQIGGYDPFFFIKTSTSPSSLTGVTEYKMSSATQITDKGASNGATFNSHASGNTDNAHLRINSSDVSALVTLYFDGTKVWYDYSPAVINTINLSANRLPPGASITATPSMYYKGAVNKAYCWGVYSDAACTSKVNGVSIASVGDGAIEFTVPQAASTTTYYLKLTIHSTTDCSDPVDDEEVVSFTVTTSNMVFFNNTATQWSSIYAYFLGTGPYWDATWGSGCKNRDGGQANRMNRIGKTEIYYFDYTGHNTGFNSEDTVYIAFTEIGKPDADKFYYTKSAYRADFSQCAPMFVSDGTIAISKNSCDYYSNGYWTTYGVNGQARSAGFTLHVYDGVETGSQIAGGEHVLTNTDGSNTYKATVTLPSRNYTYGFKLESCGHIWYGNGGTMTAHNSTAWPQYTGTNNCGVSSMAAGKYTFIVQCADDGNLKVSVEYPLMDGDYRLVYNDTCSYQTGWHPSQFIRNSKGESQLDTVSMYIRPDKNPTLKIQVCSNASLNPPTWRDSTTYDVSRLTDGHGVYNFYISQADGKLTINKAAPYTGLYYIRTQQADGGWTSYKTDKDNRMTYTEYAEQKNYGFNYYKAKWVGTSGADVTYTIACDYSESLCDTLFADPGDNPLSLTEAQNLPHTASVRFGWNSKTNTLKRAYINGSSNVADRYLVLKGVNSRIFGTNGTDVKNDNALNDYEYKFQDLNNWIYQVNVKANCSATAYLAAKYDNHVQDFIGTSSKGDTVLSGTYAADKKYAIRIIYDFKTNRLLCAWLADGTTITEEKAINADVMIVRQHHEDAAQIRFTGDAQLTDVKTVYGVLQLVKDTMTNTSTTKYHRGLYWISFPFDVKLSEVFGFGEYGTHWVLEYYDGEARAREGFWAESDGFWRIVSPAQRASFTMKANVGYVIGLDVDLLQDGGNTDIWGNNVQEVSLYFPSASPVKTINGTLPSGGSYTVPSYECSITRDSRNIKDSHWNIIGVPSYANVTGNNVVENVTIGDNELPFLYQHNMNDNSISVVSAGARSNFTFRAMHAYYVQYAGTIDWTVRDPFPNSGLAPRRNENGEKDEYLLELVINEEDPEQKDNTFIRLTDESTASFELSKDLAKAFNRGKVNLYTLIDGVEAAGNNLPLVAGGVTYIPVGVKTYGGGTYTISLPEGTDDLEVYLLDQATGARTNLAVSGYEVVLPNGVTDDRFMLEIGRNNAPTAVESVDAEGKKVVKFIENDMLYILKDGNIYDARGARVK